MDERASGFTKSPKWHDCDSAVVTHAPRQVVADAVMIRCLEKRAPHIGLTWQLLSRRDLFACGRLRREDNSSCNTRHGAPAEAQRR